MNKQQFLQALRKELSKLPPEEIVEATEYFEECFAEATDGLDEEARLAEEERLIGEFGNPKKIASEIKADYAARLLDGDETTTVAGEKAGTKHKLSAVWWIIIGICSAPVAVPIAACAIAAAITIFAGIICCIAGGIAGIVMGCISLASSASAGIMTIGIGLMILAASIVAAVGAFVGTRAIIRVIARNIRQANKRRKADRLTEGSGGEWVSTVTGDTYSTGGDAYAEEGEWVTAANGETFSSADDGYMIESDSYAAERGNN